MCCVPHLLPACQLHHLSRQGQHGMPRWQVPSQNKEVLACTGDDVQDLAQRPRGGMLFRLGIRPVHNAHVGPQEGPQ